MVHWEKRLPTLISHRFQQIVNVPSDMYHINLFQFFLIYNKIVKFVASYSLLQVLKKGFFIEYVCILQCPPQCSVRICAIIHHVVSDSAL